MGISQGAVNNVWHVHVVLF